MERIERINIIIVNLVQQQQADFVSKHDLYTIEVDKDRNCYSCEGFLIYYKILEIGKQLDRGG